MARAFRVVAGTMLLVGTAIACATAERPHFDQDRADADADAPPAFGGDGGDGCASTELVCSRDLHAVLDACTREVVETCPPEMGCAEGRCVPACASAEANKGTVGCTFWTIPSSGEMYEDETGACFAASITNTWSMPVGIEAEYDGAPLDISKSTFIPHVTGDKIDYEPLEGPLPPGQVAIIFLSQASILRPSAIRCPRPAAMDENPLPFGSGRGHAFRLSTDFPVSAYSVFPYGGAASAISAATVLLPLSSWGQNYLMVDGWDANEVDEAKSRAAIQIVAAYDDTRVKIGDEVAGTFSDASAPGTTELTLSKGEVLQLLQRRNFTGKPVEADKPIALFGGADCFDVPPKIKYCDSAHQQIPPLAAWGNEYVAVRYRNRADLWFGEGSAAADETVPWRIVGAADDTTLTYEPERPPTAPLKLAQGESRIFWAEKPFVVRSQDSAHPFYLAGYMTGADSDGTQKIGDPDFVNIVPADQYLDSYVFFADVTYEFTTLTVIRRNDGAGFADVTLDCAGVLHGWRKLDGSPADGTGRFEYTYVDLVRHGDPQPYAGGGTCGSGRHEMKSDGPFGVTVWGLAPYDSYAYPGGAGLRPLSNVRVPVK